MYQERHNMIEQADIVNMWCISTNRVSSSTTDVSLIFTPVLNLVLWLQSSFSQSFICGFYEARCWTQCRPCQGRVHETGIFWSITGFHFNKLTPNYPSVIVPRSYTCVWLKYKVSLSWFDTQRTFSLSLLLYTWNVFKGRNPMESQIMSPKK